MRSLPTIIAGVAFVVISIVGIGGVTIAAPAGSIKGSVHADDGTAIEGATVSAYDWDTLAFEDEARTSADGTYSITGLPSGRYRVVARATRYRTEYWNEASNRGDADMVTVTDPDTTYHIDFTLAPASTISGHVYRGDGTTPIPNAQVVAYEAVTEAGTWTWMADAYASVDGSYSITAAMGPGSYLVMARSMGYAAEYYYNASTQGAATPVVVTAGRDTAIIDFTLTQTGYISGTIYQADGVTPLTIASIRAYDSTTGDWRGYAHSASTGFYHINLAPGTYRLMAEASGYVTEWYLNADNFDMATPVAVVGVNEKPNINFTLEAGLAVTTNHVSFISHNSAQLNGELTSLGTASKATVSFEWGRTRGGPYPNSTSTQMRTGKGAFYTSVGGLSPGTTYYYKAKAVGDGDPVYGVEESFTTVDTTAPAISLVKSDNITSSAACIIWTTDEAATSQVEYGLTEEYGSFTTLDTNLATSHSEELTGLKAGKTYHYRVISKDAANNQAASADATFTTATSYGGVPVWAWVIIALAGVAGLSAAAFIVKGRLARK